MEPGNAIASKMQEKGMSTKDIMKILAACELLEVDAHEAVAIPATDPANTMISWWATLNLKRRSAGSLLSSIDDLSKPLESVMAILDKLKPIPGAKANVELLGSDVKKSETEVSQIRESRDLFFKEYKEVLESQRDRIKKLLEGDASVRGSNIPESERKLLEKRLNDLIKKVSDLQSGAEITKTRLGSLYNRIYLLIPDSMKTGIANKLIVGPSVETSSSQIPTLGNQGDSSK